MILFDTKFNFFNFIIINYIFIFCNLLYVSTVLNSDVKNGLNLITRGVQMK